MPPSLPGVRTCSDGSSNGRDDDRFQFVIKLPPVAFRRKAVIPHQNQPVGFQSELGVNDAPTKRCHKKEGEMISDVEIPNIVNTDSMRFAEIFKNRKNVTIGIVSKLNPSNRANLVILVLWTSRD
jgi:hypothetical protein